MWTDLGASELGGVEVNYAIGDIVALQIAAWRYWLRMASFPFILLSLLSLIPAVTGEESFQTAVASIDWSVAAIISMIWIGALMFAIAVGYSIRRFRGKHDDFILGLGEDGALFRGPEGEGTIYWKSLKRVSSNGQRLFLFLSSSSALILPRRCFNDPATFDRWANFSKAHWLAANNQAQ